MRGNRNSLHVVRGPAGWVVRKYGSRRATRRFTTKQQAVDWGRALSQQRGVDFIVFREDGTIQEVTSRATSDDLHPTPTSP